MTEGRAVDRSYQLHAIFCAAVLLACALLTRPFVETGIHDDFGYIRSAQLLAQTGQIHYNGTTPMLGWQLYLGALFIKLFGFSFSVVRAPILALSTLTTYLLHRVMAAFGLSAKGASLGTLTVMLSPVWLILTVTFMTDAAGLFCLLLCLYACQQAILSHRDSRALLWFWFAAVSNIAGGTVRQIAWVGLLVIIPSTAWLLRRRSGFLVSGAVLWISGAAVIAGCMHWFLCQPGVEPESLLARPVTPAILGGIIRTTLRILPSLPLIALPVMMLFVSGMRSMPLRMRNLWITASCVVSTICVAGTLFLLNRGHRPEKFLPPWIGSDWTIYGVMQSSGIEIAGHNAVVLLPVYQIALMLGVVVASIALAMHLATTGRASIGDASMVSTNKDTSYLNWEQTAALLLPFSAAYYALLLPRAAASATDDRYLMPLVIVLIILLLRFAEQHIVHPASWLSASTLLLFAYFAVAGTHDRFAFERARLQAAQEVLTSGVPRTHLEGGFEYDGWTQIVNDGFIDDPRMKAIYHPTGRSASWPCHSFMYSLLPAVQAQYEIAFKPQGCFASSQYSPVAYNAWLPPHTRKVYIQKLF